MRKILAIALKEVTTFFRDRNLVLLSFATPLALSTIIGLAFGGAGSSDTPAFADIALAVVNLDEGVDLLEELNLPAEFTDADALPFDPGEVTLPVGGGEIRLSDLMEGGSSLNFGDQVAAIFLAQPAAPDGAAGLAGLDPAALECSLLDDAAGPAAAGLFAGGPLDDLLDAVPLRDASLARAGVDSGAYDAALIIPPGFSRGLAPRIRFGEDGRVLPQAADEAGVVELYASGGSPVSSRIVHSIATAVVGHLRRIQVAVSATLETSINALLDSGEPGGAGLVRTGPAQGLNAQSLGPLGCLIAPAASNITIARQPLTELQQAPLFARIIVPIGASQAVFFALFTGIFGMHSIYEERRQWTLQRLIVSPTPRHFLLAGKLLGNLVVTILQILILLAALTAVASAVIGRPTMVWGTNLPALLLVTLALGLCASGLGVFVVGLARTPEQVTLFGPLINIALAVLGGAFGFALPDQVARISLIFWGVDAFDKVASAQAGISANLLVLFGQGLLLFLLGTWLFKRRLEL